MVKIRLVIMMFLQYAIWGAWSPALSQYLQSELGFSGTQVGLIYSLLPLATIISPFIGGQLADRYLATQKVLALFHLFGGAVLFWAASIQDYTPLAWILLFYSLLYAPTLALTNSLAFHHLSDTQKEFGWIRVGGSFGWIAAGLILSGWRIWAVNDPTLFVAGDTLMLAAILSVILGLYCWTLPHTPPNKEAKDPLAFMVALRMLKNKHFAIFMGIVFIVSTELMFYYVLTAPFLTTQVGVSSQSVAGVMVIAQIAEIFTMALLLPYFLPKFGIRKTIAVGILAWPIRYAIFALGEPGWLVIASLVLHGFCYVFFFTAAQIYVDQIAPKDIRASAQSLLALVNLGIGLYVGSLFAGWIQNKFSTFDAQGTMLTTNWTGVFVVPLVLTIIAAIAFFLSFKRELHFQFEDSSNSGDAS